MITAIRIGEVFRRIPAIIMVCVALAALPVSDAESADAESNVPITSLFDGEVLEPVSLSAFLRWEAMLQRHHTETNSLERSCDRGFLNRCRFQDWVEFLRSLDGKNAWTQLSEVNHYINRLPYAADRFNYGSRDYWATPRQFFYRSGDCEDYAIAKFLSLRALGWPKEALRLVGVEDSERGTQHAIIVARLNGDDWVLDNQYEEVVSVSHLPHYRLLWSLSENQSWRVAKTQSSPAAAENQNQRDIAATASNGNSGALKNEQR